MKIVEVNPEFQDTTDEEIDEALADPSPENPVAHELSRLITGYGENLTEHINKIGHIPESILRVRGSCPIEKRAMALVTAELREMAEEFNKPE